MNNNNRQISFALISKYRAVLMGIAIIVVMFCHLDVAQKNHDIPVTTLASLLQTGSVGVDIFLFLSGFGLYYSCTKKPLSYFAFEKKRFLRVLPWYFCIAGPTYLINALFIERLGFGKFVKDLFFISWVKDGMTRYWYILAILLYYLFFPLIYRFVKNTKHVFLWIVVVSALWIFAAETLCYKIEQINSFSMALSRLPIFLLGTYCGKQALEERSFSRLLLLPLLFCGPIFFIFQKIGIPFPLRIYAHYPIRGLLGLSIITATILILEFLEQKTPKLSQRIVGLLGWFGTVSLELYLLHQSALILTGYPYSLLWYPVAAFLLPVAAAFVIDFSRKKIKAGKAKTA